MTSGRGDDELTPGVQVLIVHPRDPAAPSIGGIQTFLGDFIKYAPDDFAISFVGLSRAPQERPIGSWQRIEVNGRSIHFLAVGESGGKVGRSPRAIARSMVGMARLWRALAVPNRILQLHRPYRSIVMRRHHGPQVQFIHLDLRDWPGPSGWPKLRSLYREFSDETLEQMDRVFIVNETGAVLLRDEHPAIAGRIEFLPVWYDDAVFRPVDGPTRSTLRAELRRELELHATDEDALVLLAVRLTEIKKPLLAIETLQRLLADGRTTRLLVAGAGELRDEMVALARRLDVAERVHFLGDRPREDVARLMQACDALLLTARSEGGGPRVVVEALASGLPVVSTRVVEVTRTVTTRGNGWLVDEPTPEALAEGLGWVLDQPHESFRTSTTTAASAFTARNVLSGLYATYRELAGASGRRAGSDQE